MVRTGPPRHLSGPDSCALVRLVPETEPLGRRLPTNKLDSSPCLHPSNCCRLSEPRTAGCSLGFHSFHQNGALLGSCVFRYKESTLSSSASGGTRRPISPRVLPRGLAGVLDTSRWSFLFFWVSPLRLNSRPGAHLLVTPPPRRGMEWGPYLV